MSYTLLPTLADIDLKKASKAFATRFSCGSSMTGDDEIVIQGDVVGDVVDYITEHWSEVSWNNCNSCGLINAG